MSEVETVEVLSGSDAPQGSVIWLHGLGADGHDFEPIVPELRLPVELGLRFVFPHAPLRPVTINGGLSMRAWFDIISLDRSGPVDEDGIRASVALLEGLIARERERGISADKIVVAGFSQGGSIAIHGALRSRQRLAGLMGLSTYLPMSDSIADKVTPSDIPIFMAHGTLDPVLPITLGQDAATVLRDQGFNIDWHDYPMAHAVCAQEIADIRTWLLSVY